MTFVTERQPIARRTLAALALLTALGVAPAALAQTDPAAAEALFRELLAREPEFADAHINFANLLVSTQRIQEGMRHFATSLELRPDDPKASRMMGLIFAQSGQPEKAAEAFRKALKANPEHTLAAVRIRQAEREAGSPIAAEAPDKEGQRP